MLKAMLEKRANQKIPVIEFKQVAEAATDDIRVNNLVLRKRPKFTYIDETVEVLNTCLIASRRKGGVVKDAAGQIKPPGTQHAI
jgi:hypothetical protein